MKRRNELDDIDHRIITLLQQNGRMTNVDIAQIIEASETTVRNRIENLLEQDIIKIVAVVNPLKVGFRTVALIGIQVEIDKACDVASQLARMEEIRYVSYALGTYDIFVETLAASPQHLLKLVREHIGVIPDVERTETWITPEIIKRTYDWGLLVEKMARRSAEDKDSLI